LPALSIAPDPRVCSDDGNGRHKLRGSWTGRSCRAPLDRSGDCMPIAIITGSGGLIGSESVKYFAEQGFDVVGLDNDMRARFFGPEATTAPVTTRLLEEVPAAFRALDVD